MTACSCEDLALNASPEPADAAVDAGGADAGFADSGTSDASGLKQPDDAGAPDAGVPEVDAAPGTPDAAGAPELPLELAWTSNCGSIRLAVDDANVYWTERDSGFVRAVGVEGGPLIDLAQQLAPAQIVTDQDGVYWVDRGDYDSERTWVRKVALPLSPGMPNTAEEVVMQWNSYGPIMSLAVHSGNAYYGWLHQVRRVSLTDPESGPVLVARIPDNSGFPLGLIVDDSRGIWQDSDGRLLTSALDPDDVTNVMELGRVDTALNDDIAYGVDWLYWIDGDTVRRTALDGSALDEPVLRHPNLDQITGIALDSANLYFAGSQGLILKHSREPTPIGQAPVYRLVTREQPGAQALSIRAGRLYWATADCAIRSVGIE